VTRVEQESRGGGGVVTVGRLTKQKRIDLLIDAMAMLKEKGVNVPLTVIGDGPERAALEQRAAGQGVSGVITFVGAVPPGQIPKFIGNADLFAFPAVDEGLGLAAAEALMLGVPVVACRSGGVPDIVPDSGAGRLVPPGHLESFVSAMQELLNDKDARHRARDVGRILRLQLSPDAVAAVFDHVYHQALGIEHHPHA
jgi:glycosyltransferase involved in cell wall biosynthesis